MSAFDRACAPIETALSGSFRREIVADASKAVTLDDALRKLRHGMRSHRWSAPPIRLDLGSFVDSLDRRTRREGFHALHDWDGVADRVNEHAIPIDVLDYLIGQRGDGRADPAVLAILIDYYFMHLLALLALRSWDEGRADDNLDRLAALLARLQGPEGSGQRFAADAETLILVATSHYEPDERGYSLLLERVQALERPHRVRVALGHAVSLGCHLRFGFEATYGRDVAAMRADNAADYPWLIFSLATLMGEYARLRETGGPETERLAIAEALLNGLSPDVRVLALTDLGGDRAAIGELFDVHRAELVDDFERFRPSDGTYSPLSFFFNFSHNVLKGIVVDALLWGEPWPLALNDLFTAAPRAESGRDSRETLATTLMGYARAHPQRIRGRPRPAIVYDPVAGRRAFADTMRALRSRP
jgi:hypothetical protein